MVTSAFELRIFCCAALPLCFGLSLSATPSSTTPEAPPPSTPREFFNAGTRKLNEGKLREAEALFETALASQSERLQPPALYNLGHVRFGQGVEELKKGPAARPAAARARDAAQIGDEAIQIADQALAGNDVARMVASYLHGRGARKELKAAANAVRQALETCGAALTKWQRADDDFKSAVEIEPGDADAQHNAEVVERSIAKLVDQIRELQQAATALGNKRDELGEKMKQLRGRIPAPDAPPGAAGDEDDDDEQPQGPLPGQKEGPSKDGQEMYLSPEQAGWLLDSFKLGGNHRLPMGQGDEAQPKNRPRKTW